MNEQEKDKIYIDKLENWKGGRANGYYEPFKDEIHVLNGADCMLRARIHEGTHRKRRNKLTFKFASIIRIPASNAIMLAVLFGLAFYGIAYVTLQAMIPFYFFASTYIALMFCSAYEETVANRAMTTSCREIKQNGKEPL